MTYSLQSIDFFSSVQQRSFSHVSAIETTQRFDEATDSKRKRKEGFDGPTHSSTTRRTRDVERPAETKRTTERRAHLFVPRRFNETPCERSKENRPLFLIQHASRGMRTGILTSAHGINVFYSTNASSTSSNCLRRFKGRNATTPGSRSCRQTFAG